MHLLSNNHFTVAMINHWVQIKYLLYNFQDLPQKWKTRYNRDSTTTVQQNDYLLSPFFLFTLMYQDPIFYYEPL